MSPCLLQFQKCPLSGVTETIPVTARSLVIAGWAGRDTNAVEAHIRELEAIGVARPRNAPMFYRLSPSLLTLSSEMEVVGESATGEVEVVLVNTGRGLCVAIGSDHTDRKLEAVGVTLSKQICAKPVGPKLWQMDDLYGHWDSLVMRSLVWRDDGWQLYQEGTLDSLMTPEELIGRYAEEGGVFGEGDVMFCGTVPVRGGFYFAERMMFELVDPVLRRRLQHEVCVKALQIVD